jgi:hypothetical protein
MGGFTKHFLEEHEELFHKSILRVSITNTKEERQPIYQRFIA